MFFCVLHTVLHDCYTLFWFVMFCCLVTSISLSCLSLCAGFCLVVLSRCVLLWRAPFVACAFMCFVELSDVSVRLWRVVCHSLLK